MQCATTIVRLRGVGFVALPLGSRLLAACIYLAACISNCCRSLAYDPTRSLRAVSVKLSWPDVELSAQITLLVAWFAFEAVCRPPAKRKQLHFP